MGNVRATVCALTATLCLAGCTTHLESVKVDGANTKAAASTRNGAPYMLQFTQFTVKLTRTVTSCGTGLKIANKAEISSSLVDDGDYAYTVPLDTLSHAFKVSNLKMTYTDGRLTAVNASAEDRTAQTVLAGVKSIGKIATTIAGGAVSNQGFDTGCTDAVNKALVDRDNAKKEIRKKKDRIDSLTSEVARVSAAYAASGNDPTQRTALTKAIGDLDSEKILLADAERKLKQAQATLSHETTLTWPLASNVLQTDEPYSVPRTAIEKWYRIEANDQNTLSDDQKKARIARLYERIAEPMKMWFAIDRIGSYGRDPSTEIQSDDAPADAGIRLRVPAKGRLLVCQKKACTRAATDDLVAKFDTPVSQLGLIYYAGFSSEAFSNGTFELVLDAQGRPKTVGFSRTNSSAETAAGLARDVGGEFSTIYAALNTTEAERRAREIALLQQEKERLELISATDPNSAANQLAALEAQKKLDDARRALLMPDTYELTRLTAIAEAQKKYNDAIRALDSDPNAERDEQRAAIDSERLLLDAERTRIETEILLRDARDRLANS